MPAISKEDVIELKHRVGLGEIKKKNELIPCRQARRERRMSKRHDSIELASLGERLALMLLFYCIHSVLRIESPLTPERCSKGET